MDSAAIRSTLQDAIFSLALFAQRSSTQTRLWQLAAAAVREIDRQREGDPHDAPYFLKLKVYHLAAIALCDRLLAGWQAKRDMGLKLTRDDKRYRDVIGHALAVLTAGVSDLRERHNVEPAITRAELPRLLWAYFYELSRADVEADSNLIASLVTLG